MIRLFAREHKNRALIVILLHFSGLLLALSAVETALGMGMVGKDSDNPNVRPVAVAFLNRHNRPMGQMGDDNARRTRMLDSTRRNSRIVPDNKSGRSFRGNNQTTTSSSGSMMQRIYTPPSSSTGKPPGGGTGKPPGEGTRKPPGLVTQPPGEGTHGPPGLVAQPPGGGTHGPPGLVAQPPGGGTHGPPGLVLQPPNRGYGPWIGGNFGSAGREGIPVQETSNQPENQKPAQFADPLVTKGRASDPVKLVQPRVPYLAELAMDIDPQIREFARREPARAVLYYRNALIQAQQKRDIRAETEATTNLAHAYYLTGQLQRAKESYDAALAKTKAHLKERSRQAIARRNLGAALIAWGAYNEAEQQNAEALQIFTQTEDSRGLQMALNNLGVLEKNRGRYRMATQAYKKSLAAGKEQGPFVVLVLTNLGNLSRNWADYKNALIYFERLQNMAKKSENARAESEALLSISQVYGEWGNYRQAIKYGQQALDKLGKQGIPTHWVKKILGEWFIELGQLNQAEPLLKQSEYSSSLGRLSLLKSDSNQAKKYYEPLAEASLKQVNLDELFTAYTGLGKAFEADENLKQAEFYYGRALDVTEQMRSSLLLSERKNFLASKVNGFARLEPAKGLVRVTMKEQRPVDSIFPSEATRSREFADNLAQNVDESSYNVPKEIVAKGLEIENKLASVKTALPLVPKSADTERFTDISGQIKELEKQRNAFVQSLWKEYANYASVRYPRPVKLNQAAIRKDEFVIVFDLLGDALGIKVMKGNQLVDASLVPLKSKELESMIINFRKSFESANLKGFNSGLASTLYKKLLAWPLSPIPEGSSVIIIPDGVLALLPFEILVTGGKPEWKGTWGDQLEGLTYVSDRYSLTYYQSLTSMTLVRTLAKNRKPGDRILVMADPVFQMNDARAQDSAPTENYYAQAAGSGSIALMAAVEDETGGFFKLPRLDKTSDLAKYIGGLYGSKSDVYTGLQSSKKTFLSKIAPHLEKYQSVVFATHGLASNKVPGILEPVLALTMVPYGTDGLLKMSEVADLRMDADIAALIACETGTGVKLAGEGIMSMGRAFQSAGVRSVLMSLWSVSVDASVMMTEQFFKYLKEGKTKKEAWALARKEVRAGGFNNPFFWGAFILVGEAD